MIIDGHVHFLNMEKMLKIKAVIKLMKIYFKKQKQKKQTRYDLLYRKNQKKTKMKESSSAKTNKTKKFAWTNRGSKFQKKKINKQTNSLISNAKSLKQFLLKQKSKIKCCKFY